MSHKPSTPALPADLKFGNRTQVMGVFKDGGEYTVNDISERVGLSRQTVMKAVQLFVQKGIIVSAGKGCSTSIGGKRPELFFSSMAAVFSPIRSPQSGLETLA